MHKNVILERLVCAPAGGMCLAHAKAFCAHKGCVHATKSTCTCACPRAHLADACARACALLLYMGTTLLYVPRVFPHKKKSRICEYLSPHMCKPTCVYLMGIHTHMMFWASHYGGIHKPNLFFAMNLITSSFLVFSYFSSY